MEVFKTTKTEFYTRTTKHRNVFGNYDRACARKVTDWGFRVGTKVVRGFNTKRDAKAAMAEYVARTTKE